MEADGESNSKAKTGSKRKRRSTDASDDELTGGHISWSKVKADYESGSKSRALYYPGTLSPTATQSFIRGDVPQKTYDPDFAAQNGPHLQCEDSQAVYAVYPVIDSAVHSSQTTSDMAVYVGRGLSMKQLTVVIERMRLYCDVADPVSPALAETIDSQSQWSGPAIKYDKGQRRYAGGSTHEDSFAIHKSWMGNLEICILKPYSDLLDSEDDSISVPLHRCFCYVGLAANAQQRSSGHWSHTDHESPIFGLFTATLRYLYPDIFGVQHSTFRVFKTTRVEDIGLDKIIASILLSAYHWDCGLSYVGAGDSAGESVVKSGFLSLNLQDADAKITRVERLHKFSDERDARVQAFETRATELHARLQTLLNTEPARLKRDQEEVAYYRKLEAEAQKAKEERDEVEQALQHLSLRRAERELQP